MKHHIEDILLDLEFLRPFLVNIHEQDTEHSDLKLLGAHFVDVTYESE